MYRARVNGKEVIIHVSGDASVWMWDEERGQVTLANSEDAYQFCLAHVLPEDLPYLVRLLKPALSNNYMRSQLA